MKQETWGGGRGEVGVCVCCLGLQREEKKVERVEKVSSSSGDRGFDPINKQTQLDRS